MASRPPPPLAIELSRAVRAACRSDPPLTSALNAVILRASRYLRARLEQGGAVCIHGRRERLALHLTLTPPDVCLVETLTAGADPPESCHSV